MNLIRCWFYICSVVRLMTQSALHRCRLISETEYKPLHCLMQIGSETKTQTSPLSQSRLGRRANTNPSTASGRLGLRPRYKPFHSLDAYWVGGRDDKLLSQAVWINQTLASHRLFTANNQFTEVWCWLRAPIARSIHHLLSLNPCLYLGENIPTILVNIKFFSSANLDKHKISLVNKKCQEWPIYNFI